jgi:hypothetical protein
MITFNAKDKKLENYIIEMGVTFETGGHRDPFESLDDFIHEVNETYRSDSKEDVIKSSSECEYNTQEGPWRKLAYRCGYDGLKELANAVVKLMGTDKHIACPGIEGLAALTGNKVLMDACDYGYTGKADQFVVSMFYGGNRMKEWKKYAAGYITPEAFINEMVNLDSYGPSDVYGFDSVIPIGKNMIRVVFIQSEQTNNKKTQFHKALENADSLLDFGIAEKFESNVWTISVK